MPVKLALFFSGAPDVEGRVRINVITITNIAPTILLIIQLVISQTIVQLTSMEITAAILAGLGMHWLYRQALMAGPVRGWFNKAWCRRSDDLANAHAAIKMKTVVGMTGKKAPIIPSIRLVIPIKKYPVLININSMRFVLL